MHVVLAERLVLRVFFFFQAEDGIRDGTVTGVQTCALPISPCRAGRHSAAAMTVAANAILTTTSPVITRAGLEKALPAVSVCTCPAAVRSVKLSHDGANAAAAPRPASMTSTMGPTADPRGRASASGWVAGAAARDPDPRRGR